MKSKLLVLLMAVVAVVALVVAGCAPEAAPPEGEAAPPEEEVEEEEEEAPPEEEVITWKVQDSYDAANPAHITCENICKSVTAASGGRLVFKSFTGGSIVPACKETDAVDMNTIQATYTCPMYNLDKWPVSGLYSARPGQMTSHMFMVWFNHSGGVDLHNKMTEGYDLYTLPGTAPRPAEVWCLSTVKIDSLADIKGLRMRTAGDGGEVLTRMGASVIFLPGGELYEAIQRGVLDAFEYSTPAVNWDMSFQEITKYHYFSATRAPSDPLVFTVNKSEWDKLPDDLKMLVEDVVYAWATRHDLNEYVGSIAAMQKFIDYGCEMLHLPEDVEAELAVVTKAFYEEKAATEDPIYAETLNAMMDFRAAFAEYQGLNTPYVT